MPRALILGGTGLIGAAIARRLLAGGWEVDVAGRNPARMPASLAAAGARFHTADRQDATALKKLVGSGADLLADCVCYTARDARLLLPLLADVTSTVMISGKAVYADELGNHVNSDDPPQFGGPIPESQRTVPPGDMDYQSREGYGANKVAAELVLMDSGAPVTIIRPSKVHGPGTARPREWVFVKRALDRRPAVFLANRGQSVDHTCAAANIAALTEIVAAKPGRRILNCADPDAPSALEISRAIAQYLGHSWEEILLHGQHGTLGAHPWNATHPIVLDMTAAHALGYTPVGDFAFTIRESVDYLVSSNAAAIDEDYFASMLDYAAEDRYLAGR